jgi:hypothetical protein
MTGIATGLGVPGEMERFALPYAERFGQRAFGLQPGPPGQYLFPSIAEMQQYVRDPALDPRNQFERNIATGGQIVGGALTVGGAFGRAAMLSELGGGAAAWGVREQFPNSLAAQILAGGVGGTAVASLQQGGFRRGLWGLIPAMAEIGAGYLYGEMGGPHAEHVETALDAAAGLTASRATGGLIRTTLSRPGMRGAIAGAIGGEEVMPPENRLSLLAPQRLGF